MDPIILEIYTESSPNPESMKFVTSKFLLKNSSVEYKTKESASESPIAQFLFDTPFVQQVFISSHFITLTKKPEYDWYEIIPELKECIRTYITSGQEIFTKAFYEKLNQLPPVLTNENSSIDDKIIALLAKYVKPAVEMDGGNIEFKKFENGIVTLSMQGACSGCPSSNATLKNGVEGLLKRMIPEVIEVVADAD